ncbi:MAG TPA: hypothetical protein PKE29_06115 [Phycisphaerales bacterium]|nr:hypothetical protein [Phycisphaerales bacterium]
MLIPIVTTVGIAAVTAWLGFLAVRYLLPVVPNPATSVRAARQAARDRITRDPLDYVRAWVARIAPSRLKLEQRTTAAQTAVEQATERETHILTSFKDGKEPSFGFKVTAIILFVAWVISVTAVFIIDVPIVASVSGGNVLFAIVGTVLLIGLPVIFSVLLGHFYAAWRRGEMRTTLFAPALIGIVGIVVIVVGYLTTLAPVRAEVEYADKIRTVEQQLVMYQEDGDQNAISFAEQNLAELKAQQERSAQWNTVLVPISAAAEFATGFFFPIAIPLLLLADAKSSRRKAAGSLVTAGNQVTRQRARQYRQLARTFQRLGLTQLELQQHLAAVATENRTDQAGLEAARNMVAQELQTAAPAAAEPAPAAQPPIDQVITAEIVPTTEIPVAAPESNRVRPAANRGHAAAAGRRETTTTAAPVAVLDREGTDLPDNSFDLN